MSNIEFLHNTSLQADAYFASSNDDFPENPEINQLSVVEGRLYIYALIQGLKTWFPLTEKQTKSSFSFTEPALRWTVTHSENTKDFFYSVYNSDNRMITTKIENVTDNSFDVVFSKETTGKVICIFDAHRVIPADLGILQEDVDIINNIMSTEILPKSEGSFEDIGPSTAPAPKTYAATDISSNSKQTLVLINGYVYTIQTKANASTFDATTGTGGAIPFYSSDFAVRIPVPNEGNIQKVGGTNNISYAIDSDNNMYVWGLNTYGECGLGHKNPVTIPVLSNEGVLDVYISNSNSVSSHQSMFIKKSDGVYASGYNANGKLGLGHINEVISWTKLSSLPADVVNLFNMGNDKGISVALGSDGKVYAVGYNQDGRIDGNIITSPESPLDTLNNTVIHYSTESVDIVDVSNSNIEGVTTSVSISDENPFTSDYSVKFDGVGDAVYFEQDASLVLGNVFTIEAWVYSSVSYSDTKPASIYTSYNVWETGSLFFGKNSTTSNRMGLQAANLSSWIVEEGDFPTDNAWHHYAVTRDGNNFKMFRDGVLVSSNSMVVNTIPADGKSYVFIGNAGAAISTYGYNGYISDFRISNVVRYVSDFTPPTERLVSDSNTQILTCQDGRIKDNSSHSRQYKTHGNPEAVRFIPETIKTSANFIESTSWKFDGSGDYSLVANDSSLVLSGGDFTLESWVKPTNYNNYSAVIAKRQVGGNTCSYDMYIRIGTGVLGFYNDPAVGGRESSTVIPLNTWTHIAQTYSFATKTMKFWVDGVNVYEVKNLTITDYNYAVTVGYAQIGTEYFPGQLYNTRVSKVIRYTEEFVPQLAPFTTDENTSLLMCNSTNMVSDLTGKTITNYGNVMYQRGVYPNSLVEKAVMSKDYSFSFDGVNDYIQIPNESKYNFVGKPFTIDSWIKLTDYSNHGYIVSKRIGGGQCSFNLYSRNSSGALSFYNGTEYISGTVVPLNVWTHVAACYDGTSITLFMNGTKVYGPTAVSITEYDAPVCIGYSQYPGSTEFFKGKMSQTRISDVVRYTSNFTPVLEALTVDANTLYLLQYNGSDYIPKDESGNVLSRIAGSYIKHDYGMTSKEDGKWSVYMGTGGVSADGTLSLGTNNFSIKCSFKSNLSLSESYWSGGNNAGWNIVLTSSKVVLNSYDGAYNTGMTAKITSSNTIISGWNELEVTRIGTSLSINLNGVITTVTVAASFNMDAGYDANPTLKIFRLGGLSYGDGLNTLAFNGYMSNVVITKGSSLVFNGFNSNKLIDRSDRAVNLVAYGNASVSNAGFESGKYSVAFDGTGDLLNIKSTDLSLFGFGASNFTIEFEVLTRANDGIRRMFSTSDAGAGVLMRHENGVLKCGTTSTSNLSNGLWYNVKLVATGGNRQELFINGASVNVSTTAYNYTAFDNVIVGGRIGGTEMFIGNIKGLKVSNNDVLVFDMDTDSSTASHTNNTKFLPSVGTSDVITTSGNVTSSKFSPTTKEAGKWSNIFGGVAADFLSGTMTQTLGTSDFEIEFNIFTRSVQSNDGVIITTKNTNTSTTGYDIGIRASDSRLHVYSGGFITISNDPIPKNKWVNVKVTRTSNVFDVIIDGVSANTKGTSTKSFTDTKLNIGATNNATNTGFGGFISGMKVTKAGVVILDTCSTSQFKDNSSYNHALTRNGNVIVSPFSPYDNSEGYVSTSNSAYFDGVGDWLSPASSADFNFGSGDFKIELDVMPMNTSGNSGLFYTSGSNTGGLCLFYSPSGYAVYSGGWVISGSGATTLKVNQWQHVVLERISGSLKLWVDGVNTNTVAYTTSPSYASPRIGVNPDANEIHKGFIGNLNVYKAGTLVYKLNFDSSVINDSTGLMMIETVGDSKRTTLVKTSEGSLTFDGTGDYYTGLGFAGKTISSSQDFSIEAEFYSNVISTHQYIVDFRTADTNSICLVRHNTNKMSFWNSSAEVFSTSTLEANKWYSVKVQRVSGVLKIIVNGVEETSVSDVRSYTLRGLFIGSRFNQADLMNGFIKNIKMTIGSDLVLDTARGDIAKNYLSVVAALPLTAYGTTEVSAVSNLQNTDGYDSGNGSVHFPNTAGSCLIWNNPNIYNKDIIVECNVLISDLSKGLTIIDKSAAEDYGNQQFGVSSTGGIDFTTTTKHGSAYNATWGSGAGVIKAGQWYSLKAIFSLNDGIKYFVDGTEIAVNKNVWGGTSNTNGKQWTNLRADPLRIGISAFDPNATVNAYLSGFKVTDYVTSELIADLTMKQSPLLQFGYNMGGNDSLVSTETGRNITHPSSSFRDATSKVVYGNLESLPFTQPVSDKHSLDFTSSDSSVAFSGEQALNFGLEDFTIEGWFYKNTPWNSSFGMYADNVSNGFGIYCSGGNIGIDNHDIASATLGSVSTLLAKHWYHIAVTREAGVYYCVINGQLIGSLTGFAQSFAHSGYQLGRSAAGKFDGQISDFRITIGESLYDPIIHKWTDITPTDMTAITNLKVTGTQTDKFIILVSNSSEQKEIINGTAIDVDYTDVSYIGGGSIYHIDTENNLVTSGDNTSGQLGDTISDVAKIIVTDIVPTTNPTTIEQFVQKIDGTIWACGSNVNGQLGIGTVTNASTWTKVNIPASETVTKITVQSNGDKRSYFALTQSGNVYYWGANNDNQLSLSGVAVVTPTKIKLEKFIGV